MFSIKPLFDHKRVVHQLVIKELIEDVELLNQELVKSVDNGTHDTYSVGLNRVKHLINTNSLDLLSFHGGLNKGLSVQIIIIFRNKLRNVSQ